MARVDFQISDGTALVSLENCLKRSFNLQATDLIMPDPLRKLALCHNGVSLRDIEWGRLGVGHLSKALSMLSSLAGLVPPPVGGGIQWSKDFGNAYAGLEFHAGSGQAAQKVQGGLHYFLTECLPGKWSGNNRPAE